MRDIPQKIDVPPEDIEIQERNILKNYGGGCHQKIGVSYISHKLGLVVSKRGEDENGNHFESWDFIDPKDISFSSNTTDEIYPENLKNYKIFSRKELNENVRGRPRAQGCEGERSWA